MRRTVRAALLAGGVAVLGLAITPAVAATHDGPAVVDPSPVATQARGDDGAKAKVGDDDGPRTAMMHRGGPQMAAMHRAHHQGVAGGSAGLAAMHRAHHGEDADTTDMMGGDTTDMMGGTGDMRDAAGGRSGGTRMMGGADHTGGDAERAG